MKKLSDYKDDEAIELWGEMLDPMIRILGDKSIASDLRTGKPPLIIAKDIIKTHTEDAREIMLLIDPTPIDGINVIARLASIVMDFIRNDSLKDFFKSAGQAMTEEEPTGSATEITEDAEA